MTPLSRVFLAVLVLGVLDGGVGQLEGGDGVSAEEMQPEEASNGGEGNQEWNKMIASQNWNTVVDDMLRQLGAQMVQQGKDEPLIHNIEEGFKFGLVKGQFEAVGGSVKNISSLRRITDVLVDSVPGVSVTLTTHLQFGDLLVRYPHYRAKMLGVGPTGEIDARVEDNTVNMVLKINMNPDGCNISLEHAKVRLGKMHTKVTGLKPFNWLLSRIFTWLTRECKTNIVKVIEHVLDTQLKYIFSNTALDC